MTKQYVTAKELKEAADHLASTKGKGGYRHWKIPNKYHKDISIVLDWSNGFNENDPYKDNYQDGTWRLAFKVGYQPDDDKKEYDYDIDFDYEYWQYGIYETTDFKWLAKDINQYIDEEIEHWKIIKEMSHD